METRLKNPRSLLHISFCYISITITIYLKILNYITSHYTTLHCYKSILNSQIYYKWKEKFKYIVLVVVVIAVWQRNEAR